MPNLYFNNFAQSQEQDLIESLVIEAIGIYGLEVYYIPRNLRNFDGIYGEDTETSTYSSAYLIDMYVKNVDGFQGDGDFLSKFGLQIRDQMTWTVARKTFGTDVQAIAQASGDGNLPRPREGDIIFFPLNGKLFEIKFVEHESVFYQLGALQMWDLRCELFEYNNEIFNTGIPAVDVLSAGGFSTDTWQHSLLTPQGGLLLDTYGQPLIRPDWKIEDSDPLAQNTQIQTEGDDFISFTKQDPFSVGGTF